MSTKAEHNENTPKRWEMEHEEEEFIERMIELGMCPECKARTIVTEYDHVGPGITFEATVCQSCGATYTRKA